MNVQFSISSSEASAMGAFLEEAVAQARPAVHAAMGQEFYEMVQGNFGIAGVDRPMAWAPLSHDYAKKVGREIATLDLSGALRSAIMISGHEGDGVTVEVSNSSVPYATIHQTGGRNMPKRPYFPIDDRGEVLPYTRSQVVEAASRALMKELQ